MVYYYIVGAYLGGSETIVLNTSATNQIGLNAFTKTFFVLNTPYILSNIGEKLKLAFQHCLSEPSWNENMKGNLSKLIGYKSQSKFNKEFIHVQIRLDKEKEILVFTPTKREGNGYINNGLTKLESSFNATDEELGQTLLETFKLCKR